MKKVIVALFSLFYGTAQAQFMDLKWQTVPELATPESVLPYGNKLYVSQVDGGGWDVDGKGGIAIVDKKGHIKNSQWVTGLNAPKGMAIVKDILYVADITEVVRIELKSGKIIGKEAIEGAMALNDVTADPDGNLYISDSKTGKILKYRPGSTTTLIENQKDVNGVKWHKGSLYLTGNNAFQEYNLSTGVLRKICELENGGDGVEPFHDGFLVTSWLGYLYYVDVNGKRITLRETHQTEKHKTADIGVYKNHIYIPTFFGNTVECWKFKL